MAEIVGLVAGVVSPALELGKCFRKQFNYLCCLGQNIQDLTDAAKHLEDARADLQARVDGARRNGELVLHQVETWLADADETQVIRCRIIETQIPGILSIKPRYSLSRDAKKTAESMKDLRANCTFDLVSTPPLPAAMLPTPPPRPTRETESRKKIEDDIIKAIRDGEVNVIGVCGMGGVGKTTMAQRVMDRAREKEGLFDEVVMVAVGQQADMLKIQRGIADWLGIKFEEETLAPRAHRLRARLTDAKRKLIVIDDVWERIHLENLGIPVCEKTGSSCKVLLTSRHISAFDVADNKRVFTVETLAEGEAWLMFKENVGAVVEDSNLLPIASDVAKECKGLPLALVTVARSLKGKESKGIWLHALKQLRSSNPVDIEDVISKVYNPIKLSYDLLENPHAKSLLFLCSSFPEDQSISVKHLVFYSVGLCIIDEISNLEEARNRLAMLIEMLKSRFLILDGHAEHYVKMHDVVRDVAIFIAAKEKHAIAEFRSVDWSSQNSHSDCTMLSMDLKQRLFDFPMGLDFPNLHFLWMRSSAGQRHSTSEHFLEGMQQLKVLYMNSFSFAPTLQTMQLLKNLHTLHLFLCTLEKLSAVGELSSLEILICSYCEITELPLEIGRLNRLRRLEVSDCLRLKTIMPGVISRLGRLEELRIINSFKGWESVERGNKRSNVSLAELESLCNLTSLEIQIEDCTLAAEELQLSSEIVRYHILLGKETYVFANFPTYEKMLRLNMAMETLSLGNWIHVFARRAEYLHLDGDGSNSLDIAGYAQNKRYFKLGNCATVEKFVVSPVLEKLCLEWLPMLEEICDGSIPEGSNSLCSIDISGCPKLSSLFSSSVLIRSLSKLQSLEISACGSMEEVFSIELEDKDHGKSPITFPKMEIMRLCYMKSLTAFCKRIERIEFPRLVDLEIKDCPELISFTNAAAAASDENHLNSSSSSAHDDTLHLFCYKKITFGSLKKLHMEGYVNTSYVWCRHIPRPFFSNLEELHISDCKTINNLFPYSIATNLVHLKKLTLSTCDEMVYVIADDNARISGNHPLIFHKLEVVTIRYMFKLKSFCEGGWHLQLPLLTNVEIRFCPAMEGFAMGSISIPNLKEFVVDSNNENVEDFTKYPWL